MIDEREYFFDGQITENVVLEQHFNECEQSFQMFCATQVRRKSRSTTDSKSFKSDFMEKDFEKGEELDELDNDLFKQAELFDDEIKLNQLPLPPP